MSRHVVAVGYEHRLAVDGRTAHRVTDRCRCGSRVKAVTPEPGLILRRDSAPDAARTPEPGDVRIFICEKSGLEVGSEVEGT